MCEYSPNPVHTSTVVIGAGRVGRTVAARLTGSRLYGHGEAPDLRRCRRLLIATPDAAIADVCGELAALLEPGCAAVHFSGATSVHALDAAVGPRACVHPLQTVWIERGPDQLEGAFAAVTGDQDVGERLARELGMTPFALEDAAKPVYHAASAFASNYVVTLTQVAVRLLERAGLDRGQALEALAPLQRRTLEVGGRSQPPDGTHRPRRPGHGGRPPGGGRPGASPALPRARPGHPPAGAAGIRRGRAEPSVTVGLVPTMGALHDGHRALLRQARAECDRVVMSLFVNPAQFGPDEDYERYPRDEAGDREIAAREGVDEVFAPAIEEMYPAGFDTLVVVGDVAARWEGAARPAHFQGVATVVLKLLHLVQPDVAYFGRKDAQQLAVIRRMTADLAVPVEVRAVDTVREPDGLAVSSRNTFLSPDERRHAPTLHQALLARDPTVCEGDVEYLAVVDPETFAEVEPAAGALVIGAARFGGTRLIDNIRLEAP
jgi:pantoate--beta-alanine ligase